MQIFVSMQNIYRDLKFVVHPSENIWILWKPLSNWERKYFIKTSTHHTEVILNLSLVSVVIVMEIFYFPQTVVKHTICK